jgi:KaiC/GvpD/RAD55 family RecA-like ATPase/DNA-binding NarL/FixJ family response regulator
MTMLSTGIEALDARLGTLANGRYYLVSGPSGAGKTSVALHFLGAGVEAGEVCVLLSQDDPADLVAHAEHLGYDLRGALEHDRLRLLRFRLDFLRNYSRVFHADAVFQELETMLGEPRPTRLVIDSAFPFFDGGQFAEELVDALLRFLERFPGAVYLTGPGDQGAFRRVHQRLAAAAGGVFELQQRDGRGREFAIQKLRQPAKETDPFRFVIHPGAGVVEEVAWVSRDDLPEAERRRVIVLEASRALPADLLSTLEQKYDVVRHRTLEHAFGDLAGGRYGAVVIALDALDPESSFHLTQSLRRAGNGAPVLFLAPSAGLRSGTRARALRIGGDDVLTDALSPQELLERIETARLRGHRRVVATEVEPVVLQPMDEDGVLRLMTEPELCEILRAKVESGADPFFALALLDVEAIGVITTWTSLRQRIRIREGDLVAAWDDGRVALFYHDVRPEQASELIARLAELHPALGEQAVSEFYCHPADRGRLGMLLGHPEVAATGSAGER